MHVRRLHGSNCRVLSLAAVRGFRRPAALALAVALVLHAHPATAVILDAATPPVSAGVNAPTSVTVTGHTEQRNERLQTTVLTFPANTDLSGVSAATVSGQDVTNSAVIPILGVLVDAAAGSVTITTNYRRNQSRTDFSVTVGGVVNASQPGAYSYSASLTTNRNTSVITQDYSLTANAAAVTVGPVTPTPSADLVNAAYTVPVTLGPQGRLSGTTAAGANTISVTFPAGFTLPASAPASSVTLNGTPVDAVVIAGNTVTLSLPGGMTIAGGATATIAFDAAFGIRNPPAGSYSLAVSTSAESGTGTSPPFAISLVPHLSMSLDATSVDFGILDPGMTYGPVPVNVQVSSNLPVTLTRALGGDVAQMGLSVLGDAEGLKSAGTATYTDLCVLTVPWTTDPDTGLAATIAYTALQ